jgi:FkbM family methyltransferase
LRVTLGEPRGSPNTPPPVRFVDTRVLRLARPSPRPSAPPGLGAGERLLGNLGLYRPVRNAYHRLLHRERYELRRAAREFYAQFVGPGDLVFDVGANEGRYAEMYLDLGASVVAVEPQPEVASRMAVRYRSRRLKVEAVAVGSESGEAELRVGTSDTFSTLSTEWVETSRATGQDRWRQTVRVPVATLDELIARHGRPTFLKLDVEGFEAEALKGLSVAVPRLSFEFLPGMLHVARECLSLLAALGAYEFNTSAEHEFGLRHEHWIDGDTLLAEIEELTTGDAAVYAGDVYARELSRR